MNPRVLITGAAGFISGHLVDRFKSSGWEAVGLTRTQSKHELWHDLANPLPIQEEFDVVIHAAARSNPWGSKKQYLADNVTATQNVIDYCHRNGSPKLIYLSSSSVYYLDDHQLNMNEETPLPEKFVNQYAATKRAGELLIEQYQGQWSILRPRAVFGPGDTVLLPRILQAARKGKLPLLTCPDGPVIGDLIYISNLVDCIEKVATDTSVSGTINLTNDEPVPIHEFLFDVFDQLEIERPRKKVSTTTAMRVAGGLELFHRIFLPRIEPAITKFGVHVFRYSKTFDVTKMKQLLGPPKVNLKEAKRLTVDWFRQSLSESP
ncbi:NAD(P)-dependent oxidoreductase [Planctomicrobium sp.]|jgi:2-alkyl-3-oxoalkanoate reductase|nr:NAD(P)-dependent oxidoreductase [Planctomicrobium sp.]MBT5018788.1 NAD(P)-dependent oxidoreductase [Planctomicrobium sp.]MDA7527589.1 NAD(P)-dependent oxidoreductase [bacterium]MDB4732926.1 NAD(P)-dependent oxidoreductase [Planctomicrobium sp.]